MDQKECDQEIVNAAKKWLNHHPQNFKLFVGTKSYTADQIMKSLEKDKDFRKWFVTNILSLSTELFLSGKQ